MRSSRFSCLVLAATVVALASCAPSVLPVKPAEPPPARAKSVEPGPISKVDVKPEVRPPPPVLSTPMAGEPADDKLGEARLIGSSCDDYQARRQEVVAGRIRKMRAELAESYKTWHDAQPSCWEEDRRIDAERRANERAAGDVGGGSFGGSSLTFGAVGHGAGSGTGQGYGGGAGTMVTGRLSGVTGGKLAGGVASAQSHSRTNTQIVGVDEADIVKTDGKYVYFAMNGALRIAEAMSPKIVSVTKLPGVVRELFVEGDRAVVYTSTGQPGARCTYGYDCAFAGDGTSTRITVIDLQTRTAPKVVRQIELTGSLMTSRRVGNVVHTVVADGDTQAPSYASWPSDLDTCGTPEKAVRAKFEKLRIENERKIAATSRFPTLRENGVEKSLCTALLRTAIDDGQSFTTVLSFDLTKDSEAPIASTVESRPGAVFASASTLYMSVVHAKQGRQGSGRWYSFEPSVDEVSEIHAFRIGERPSDTKYMGSGVVPGHVLNQFAMDEWYGYLRVATTRGRVPSPNVESSLSILARSEKGNLVRVGAVEHIAPGEDIRSVRFDDDRGYVVTFKKTDPLFVLDLAKPDQPKILGELKIPGFSTYMQRIDRDTLLSIGFDANDHGDFAYFDGVILQLFDVKTPTEPKLLHKEKLGTRGSSSEAATNHLAFNYFAEKGLLAVPMTVCEGGSDGVHGNELAFSGLYVYAVDAKRGFTRLGGIDHGTKGVSCSTWWSHAQSAVKRSIFLDDLVYSIAGDRAKVQRMGRFGIDVADLSLTP